MLKNQITSPMQPTWDVFISAKNEDIPIAQEIYDFLQSNGVKTFFSPESLPQMGRADYRRQIDNAIDAAKHMVVVGSSSEHLESRWVEAEWSMFINEIRSGRKDGNLITLVGGGLPIEKLPISLRQYEVIELKEEGTLERLLHYVGRKVSGGYPDEHLDTEDVGGKNLGELNDSAEVKPEPKAFRSNPAEADYQPVIRPEESVGYIKPAVGRKERLRPYGWSILGVIGILGIALLVIMVDRRDGGIILLTPTNIADITPVSENSSQLPTVVIDTNLIIPTSEIIHGAVVDIRHDFSSTSTSGILLDGDSSIINGNLRLRGPSGAYFENVLYEGKSILFKFKYEKNSIFSIIAHNDQEWDGLTYRCFGIYNGEQGKPFFLAVTNGIEYIANDSWTTGSLIPEPGKWYFLLITIGGKESPFYLKVWDSLDPNKFMEMRKMLGGDWESPNWHFRSFVDSGEVLSDFVQELRIE